MGSETFKKAYYPYYKHYAYHQEEICPQDDNDQNRPGGDGQEEEHESVEVRAAETGRGGNEMIIKSRAPCRISIGGGGSDLPEFYSKYGGCALNFGISLYSYVSLRKYGNKNAHTRIIAPDWNINRPITNVDFEKPGPKNVDLVKAVMRDSKVDPTGGYELSINSAAKRNSGLAGSSALLVSLMGAFYNQAGKQMVDRHKIAESAYFIERMMLKRVGGSQDMYASVFGGFNFFEFGKYETQVSPLRLGSDLLAELYGSMLLFETPCVRKETASEIESRKVENLDKNAESLKNIRDLAYSMKPALINGDLETVGLLMDESWKEKKAMDGVSNPRIDFYISIAKRYGAYGAKLCGAGGGGFIFSICPFEKRNQIVKRMEDNGCRAVNFGFDLDGIMTWRTR